MADRSRYDDEVVTKSAATIVDQLGEQLPAITRAIRQIVERDIAELRGDAQLLGLLQKSVEGNIETVFNALHYDIPIERVELPTAALEHARRLAQHGVPSNAIVRAYRLGHQALLSMVVDAINEAGLDPALGLAVLDRMTTVTFRYIDWISQSVVNVYETERDLWLENRSRTRSVRVAEILEGGHVDIDAMTSAIGYPLRRTHVAVVLWFANDSNTGNELARLERCLRELAEHLDSGNALFVAADRVTGWGWIPLANAGGDPIARIRKRISDTTDAPHVAVGAALSGVDGFRRSHRQAQNARRVAVAAGPPAPRITAASDPGLSSAALVSTDLAEARAWVKETLGPLAADSENDALLRKTLRVFLHESSSYKAAAEELNMHSNSVKYRVQRAVARRGRPITDDRLDVELALLVCHWFGAAVLAPDRGTKRTAK